MIVQPVRLTASRKSTMPNNDHLRDDDIYESSLLHNSEKRRLHENLVNKASKAEDLLNSAFIKIT